MRIFPVIIFYFIIAPGYSQKPRSKNPLPEISTPTGLRVLISQKGHGVCIEKGDRIRLHYTGFLQDNKIFDSSVEKKQPFEFVLGVGQVIPGWEEGIIFLRKGSKARLFVPAALGYGDIPMPGIPVNSDLIFDLEILEVEKGVLPALPKMEKNKTISCPSGLKYKILRKGKGLKLQNGNTIEVHYTGYLENGNVFESSVLRDKTVSFVLGTAQVLKGWEEAVSYLHVGDKALIFLPSDLAYGQSGRPPLIPADAKLFFVIEIISVK